MMQQLRKQTRLVLFIALAAFALLIFFNWGINITGIKTDQKTDIAKIDGIPLSYRDYIRFMQIREREQKNVSREELWSEIINEIMWSQLLQKEKIRVTDEEIWTIIRNNPPQELYEAEYMKDENGEFDFNKYFELLRSPQSRQWLLQYEYNLREQLPREKLRSLIATMTWVSPFEDSVLVALQTAKYNISFISIPLFKLRRLIQIPEEELKGYYAQHPTEFIRPEMKTLRYVIFDRVPSHDDTVEIRETMEDFIMRIKEDKEDFLETAKEVSDDSIVEYRFGNVSELPSYLQKVYRELNNGELSDIIEVPGGFEVVQKIHSGLLYRAKVNVYISPTTLGEIYDKIMSFKETAQEIGFDSTGVEFGVLVRKTPPLTTDKISFPVRNPATLAEHISHAKKGEVFGPLAGFESYYIFMVDSIIPESKPTFEEIVSDIRATLERNKLYDAMAQYLSNLQYQLQSGETMEAIAASDTLVIFRNDLKNLTLSDMAGSYGEKFAGAVARLEPQEVSTPLLTDWAGYIIRCDQKIPTLFDSTMIVYLQDKRQKRLQQLSQNIFTPKEIEDYRDEFFE
jgi:peptidyl-prolyl cis-trans isomerase D